ncbi:hypothetical protein BG011_007247 [Mortierella polycephala]|uniref:Uncharacterized protein n=1 Tax=Mortierella polycephala TaxID=41804 RepID=A0A9P6U8K0_9FUNG|nr:hypothetical protein BG011_007247 [Mortierella polycephala]
MFKRASPLHPAYYVLSLCLFLIFLADDSAHFFLQGQGLVVAAKRSLFFKRNIPNPEQVLADTHKAQQVVADLRALSSSASRMDATADKRIESDTQKIKRLSKGNSIEDLLRDITKEPPSFLSSTLLPEPQEGSITEATEKRSSNKKNKKKKKSKGEETKDKKKKSIGYEDDIIHEHDHANNDAYDDIVWYDGPHRDDEDEHGDEHGDDHGDHDDHDDDDHNVFGGHEEPEAPSNLQNFGGARARNSGGTGTFHHSGADILEGTISPQEFCLRLKHECESTCREFVSQVEHLPMTCEAGSMAELLLWGRCCQVGQENRAQRQEARQHADLEEKHVRWQHKRHQAQQELKRETVR